MCGLERVNLDFLVLPQELTGIEVYTRPGEIPAEYCGAEPSACGPGDSPCVSDVTSAL